MMDVHVQRFVEPEAPVDHRSLAAAALIFSLTCSVPNTLYAAPISIIDPNNPTNPFQIINQYSVEGPSSWGGPGGSGILTGFGFVEPGGKESGTTGDATQNGTVIPLSFSPVSQGDQSYFGFTSDLTLTDEWTLRLQNENDSLTVQSPSIDTSNLAPDISGLKAEGIGTVTPTFTWEDPGGQNVSIDIAIYDLATISVANSRPFVIRFDSIPTGQNSYTVPEGVLDEEGFYTFSVRSAVLRTEDDISDFDGTSLAGSFESLNATFFDFVTGDVGEIPVAFLPQVDESGGGPKFVFDNLVSAGLVEFYDPVVAIGYDYEIGQGDPLFNSVILPNIGDGVFQLLLRDALGDLEFVADLFAGEEYFFDGGVDMFRILGIENSAGIDPSDPTAFATGLSFVADGRFTGTMTPISQEVRPVPLPATAWLMLAGIGLLSGLRRTGKGCWRANA